jgi:TetR/AcrR family transcriptional repressor of nem operon
MNPVARETGTREKILAAGAQAVSAKSFNSCGLSEILELAGVPKGSFYHYFQSKEDFGVALIEHEAAEFMAYLRPIVSDRKRAPLERLRAISAVAQGAERQCLVVKLAMEAAQLSEPVHAAVKSAYSQWSALIAQVIREGQAAGEIGRRQDPEKLANLLAMLWEGATIRMQVDRSPQPVEDFLTFVFDSLLRDWS